MTKNDIENPGEKTGLFHMLGNTTGERIQGIIVLGAVYIMLLSFPASIIWFIVLCIKK